ncbi:hypothetical protein [Tepidimonas sp.]|jgi:hypothetical protein|uniref:hypothetical protein n=1 Tax=Tepidimonas sp. TaxID=2002775 RepID=UPI0028CC9E59|nr:hypothetical protein [Tepidimonas sp.]MDT7928965.1 hypothetical protein [Tepidimonas sp.]
MKPFVQRFFSPRAAARTALGLGLAALGAAAQAGDVYWSIGVHQPGVSVGVGNYPPVVVAPAPRVVMPPVVVTAPAPVVVVPSTGYWVPPGHRRHPRHGDREYGRVVQVWPSYPAVSGPDVVYVAPHHPGWRSW